MRQARNFARRSISMHDVLVGGANDFRLRSLEGCLSGLSVALGDRLFDRTDASFDAGAARLVDHIAARGNAGGFFCRTGVGHSLVLRKKPLPPKQKPALLPEARGR